MMGVKTGDMPEVDLIWAIQHNEGSEMCFGQGYQCKNRDCRWRDQCIALDFYDDMRLPIAQTDGMGTNSHHKTVASSLNNPPKKSPVYARVKGKGSATKQPMGI